MQHGYKLPPPFVCRSASLADARSLTSIFIRSFEEDEMSHWIYQYAPAGTAERESRIQFAIDFRLPDFKRMLVKRDYHPFVVKDEETDEGVALANWQVTPPSQARLRASLAPVFYRNLTFGQTLRSWMYWTYDKISKLVPDWLYKFCRPRRYPFYQRKQRWFTKVLKNFKDSLQEEDKRLGYWTLTHLGVHPARSGQGIASALLQWGLQKADLEDRAIYIVATIAGSKLYAKHGFTKVSSDIYFPGEPGGGFQELMMRRPRFSERK
ncbi:hypothetical protein P389DRAFT_95354 [Cystobasidium minutum MCA 4210]|uniref:uncharacterized protein n=1 Tax=Cystobasidium minutum MCA 4210 TaxID=1397322 RepID=UPI0034CDF455|eukprot:jgi/Rhomi1/95354/CE95353_1557